MPHSKTDLFSDRLNRISAFSKILAHPARVSILEELAGRSTCVCGEIVDVVPLAQATVSQHLKELHAAGLIKGEVDGSKSCYCIDPEGFGRLEKELIGFLENMRKHVDINCC